MDRILKVKIGGVTISATGDGTCPPFVVQNSHQPFLVHHARADVTLKVQCGEVPAGNLTEPVFECDGPWSIYRHQDRFYIHIIPKFAGDRPYRLAVLDSSFTSGDLHISQPQTGADADPFPFLYPFDELLMINLLARSKLGVIAHALGIVDDGRGLLFCGVSGAGKSTLAGIWEKTGVTLLSDDRIIVRPQDDQVMIYGTPWHGDAKIASPQSAPLEKLYFISHSSKNQVAPLTQAEAATRLLVRCFPPFYDREGMDNVLELTSRIVARIPCYDLGFVPDESIVDFIREHHETG
jgi:hypothetical protein